MISARQFGGPFLLAIERKGWPDGSAEDEGQRPGQGGHGGKTGGHEQPPGGSLGGGFVLDGDRAGGGATIADHFSVLSMIECFAADRHA
jgi:hypothetical protein